MTCINLNAANGSAMQKAMRQQRPLGEEDSAGSETADAPRPIPEEGVASHRTESFSRVLFDTSQQLKSLRRRKPIAIDTRITPIAL